MLTDLNIKERMQHYKVTGLSLTAIMNAEISAAEQYGLSEAGTSRIVNSHSIFNACSKAAIGVINTFCFLGTSTYT